MGNVYNDDTEWKVTGYKEDVTVESGRDGDDYVFTSDAKDKRKLLMYRDSFGYALMGIAKDFGEVRISRNTDDFAAYCKEMQPDILVIEMVERWREGQETWCNGLYDLIADLDGEEK